MARSECEPPSGVRSGVPERVSISYMYGLKCLIAVAIPKASTSHGIQRIWCARNFAQHNPADRGLPSLTAYIVAPMPLFLAAPSVAIHSVSDGRGKVID